MDNIFIERLWRSLKYEAVYLQDIATGFTAGARFAIGSAFATSRDRTWHWTGEPRPKHAAARRLWI